MFLGFVTNMRYAPSCSARLMMMKRAAWVLILFDTLWVCIIFITIVLVKVFINHWYHFNGVLLISSPSQHSSPFTADTSWLHQQLSSSLQFEILDESNTFPANIEWSMYSKEWSPKNFCVFMCVGVETNWSPNSTINNSTITGLQLTVSFNSSTQNYV